MTSVVLGTDPQHLQLKGVIADQNWVTKIQYEDAAPWPGEPRLVFDNGDQWVPLSEGNDRIWNIPAVAVNRVLDLDTHGVQLFVGTVLHSHTKDGF